MASRGLQLGFKKSSTGCKGESQTGDPFACGAITVRTTQWGHVGWVTRLPAGQYNCVNNQWDKFGQLLTTYYY